MVVVTDHGKMTEGEGQYPQERAQKALGRRTRQGPGRTNKQQRIVIIGAGVGGTCLAARLGAKGYRVTVLEKNDDCGGRCSVLRQAGHRWDVGPSLYLMPELFQEAFEELGENLEDHYKLTLCSPSYQVHFADGQKLSLSSDLAQMAQQLERFERPRGNPDPMGSFLRFLREAGVHYEESVKHVLKRDWSTTPLRLLRTDLLPMLWRTSALHVHTNLYRRSGNFFRSDHIRRATTFSSMYMGMSPFHAPATYSLLQYAEYAKGIWYPIGGFQRVPASFERIAREKFGAEFRYGATVKRICISEDGRTTTGVQLEDGQVVTADVVVSNADLVWTYENLLPRTSYLGSLERKEQTCSSISFYWGLSRKVPQLGAHNIFLADAYRESFDEIFEDGRLPSHPSFYVNVPSRLDDSAAPDGKETVVVLVPCGPIETKFKAGCPDSAQKFLAIRDRAKRQIIHILDQRLGPFDDVSSFGELIEQELVYDPFDWREKFNLYRGSILGLSHTLLQVLCLRPSTQHSEYGNLFFVGASTQPGTGVPVVVAGSEVVASRIDRYLLGKRETLLFEYLLVAIVAVLAYGLIFHGW